MPRRNARSVTESIVKYSGRPQFLGVLTTGSGTSINNHTTAAPFNNTGNALLGKVLILQSDVAYYLVIGQANTVAAVASATGSSMLIQAGERVTITMDDIDSQVKPGEFYGWLAVIPTAAVVANVKVWELT